ncbi:hypothetical protein BDV59DRAFT_207089 [Aspergillus ambiguus]|uniref:agmatine deiminase family protein n=1 Tax=Aspergillus ambiguus TaxID=176160 RepID=UPI003CCDC304
MASSMKNVLSATHAGRYLYPAGFSRHVATILGFPSKYSIAPDYYEDACREIATLGAAISEFEPVRLYARSEDVSKAESLVSRAIPSSAGIASNVTVIPTPTNHLWVRDTGPVYVRGVDDDNRGGRFAVNFRFCEWGRRDEISDHHRAADGRDWPVMTAEQLRENNTFATRVIENDESPSSVTQVESKVCLEGGALVVDGEGTLLATESSILNENRNPGLSRTEIEDELRRVLGITKFVWFPGKKDLDVTDVHADAEVNFIRPGVVVLSRPHSKSPPEWVKVYEEIRDILAQSIDAKGRPFEVHTIDEPDPAALGPLSYDDVATNYVNFYMVNGGLIVPQFGDEQADRAAIETCQKLCPERKVKGVPVCAIPLAGGVIHCSTQQICAVDE